MITIWVVYKCVDCQTVFNDQPGAFSVYKGRCPVCHGMYFNEVEVKAA